MGDDYRHKQIKQQLQQALWQPAAMVQAQCPAQLWEWLSIRGSLSKALHQVCHKRFHVDVLAEGEMSLAASEIALLEIAPLTAAYCREVNLLVDENIWIYARSVFPQAILQQNELSLLQLGQQPLGSYLFQHKQMSRGEFQFACLDADSNLWARRSLFYLSSKPLLVSEVFMPSVLNAGNNVYTAKAV